MKLFTVSRGIAVAGIAATATLTVPALAIAGPVSTGPSVAQAVHSHIALTEGPGDPNIGQGGGPNPGTPGGGPNPGTPGSDPGNPSTPGSNPGTPKRGVAATYRISDDAPPIDGIPEPTTPLDGHPDGSTPPAFGHPDGSTVPGGH